MSLAALVHTELRVVSDARALTFKGARGKALGTMRVVRSPMRRLREATFRKRLARLSVDPTELETLWRVEVGGRHVVDVVHLFPHNVFAPTGTPPGRGYEVRSPQGRVIGFTDQRGRVLLPTLLYRNASGELLVQAALEAMRSRLSFRDADGRTLLDLSRRFLGRESWRTLWLGPDLGPDVRNALAACLLVAVLWAPRS